MQNVSVQKLLIISNLEIYYPKRVLTSCLFNTGTVACISTIWYEFEKYPNLLHE